MVKIAGVDDFLPPKQSAPTVPADNSGNANAIIDGIMKLLDHPTTQAVVSTVVQRVQFVTAQQAAKAQQEQAGAEQQHNAVLFED